MALVVVAVVIVIVRRGVGRSGESSTLAGDPIYFQTKFQSVALYSRNLTAVTVERCTFSDAILESFFSEGGGTLLSQGGGVAIVPLCIGWVASLFN